MKSILISPHNDDEAIFASFSVLRERPLVVVVFDSYVQENRGFPITATQRRMETRAAMNVLGTRCGFLGFRDDAPPSKEVLTNAIRELISGRDEGEVKLYAPAFEKDGHAHHNLVAEACAPLEPVESYLTYTPAGKSVSKRPVSIGDGRWIALKHKALACYESQLTLVPGLGCWPHFMRDMTEYYA